MMAGKSRHSSDAKLIELLAAGTTQAEAARLVGCSARTVSRRLEDAKFAQAVDDFRAQMLVNASGRLVHLVDAALDGLRELVTSDCPPGVKLAAARCVLKQAVRFREAATLERRVQELAALVKSRTD